MRTELPKEAVSLTKLQATCIKDFTFDIPID